MNIDSEGLDLRLRTLLPQQYQDRYEAMQPVSMGTAPLKYGIDGKVAWREIWGSFCDLAMAGGPPHKGSLLEPASVQEIEAQSQRYQQVVNEICRGVTEVTGLGARPSLFSGWVRVACTSEAMAAWLVRAIVMENVSARCERAILDLPAGPAYRIEKEIKNVITVIAKTCHYWCGHIGETQRRAIANLFARMETESALVQPAPGACQFPGPSGQMLSSKMSEMIHQLTGLRSSNHQYSGWLGVECPNIQSAIWMMRAMVATNVLSRREGTILFLPINPASDPDGTTVVQNIVRVQLLAKERGVL